MTTNHLPRYRQPFAEAALGWWYERCDRGRADERALLALCVALAVLCGALCWALTHRQTEHVWTTRRVYHVVKVPTPRKAGPRD